MVWWISNASFSAGVSNLKLYAYYWLPTSVKVNTIKASYEQLGAAPYKQICLYLDLLVSVSMEFKSSYL